MRSKQIILLVSIALANTSLTEDEPIERNPFDRKPPTREESEKMMMQQLKEFDTFVGYDDTKPGKDGFFNHLELNNYFKSTKPFIPKKFFEPLVKYFHGKLKENDGLINLRFYSGLSEAFSEEFRSSMTKQEMFEMQTEQADPYYKLDKEIEVLLGIDNAEEQQTEFTAKLLQEQSDKQLLDQIKYFDTFVGDDTSKKGKDGFLNEQEFLNQVNQVMQGNPDKDQVREFKLAQYNFPTQKQQSKVNYNQLLALFDDFQDNYFKQQPEKWKEVEENMMKEHQEREKKMLEYKEEMKKKIESGEIDERISTDDQDNKSDL